MYVSIEGQAGQRQVVWGVNTATTRRQTARAAPSSSGSDQRPLPVPSANITKVERPDGRPSIFYPIRLLTDRRAAQPNTSSASYGRSVQSVRAARYVSVPGSLPSPLASSGRFSSWGCYPSSPSMLVPDAYHQFSISTPSHETGSNLQATHLHDEQHIYIAALPRRHADRRGTRLHLASAAKFGI